MTETYHKCLSRHRKILLMTILFTAVANTGFAQQLPIKPARTISFRTDEGSYMSVAISPDGRTLAFDLLGDLYTLPVEGGQATQLTHGLAMHFHPAWSPDNKSLAFISDTLGDLHVSVMDMGTKHCRVLSKNKIALTYQSFAFWTADSRVIYTDGQTMSALTGEIIARDPIKSIVGFSPDGRLSYGAERDQLYAYDLPKQKKMVVTNLPHPAGCIQISPDGHWLGFITSSGKQQLLTLKRVATANDTLTTQLILEDYPTEEKAHIDTRDRFAQGFSFSPDSRYVYIGYNGKLHRVEVTSGQSKVIAFDAKVRIDAGAFNYHTFRLNDGPFDVKYIRSVNTSPDGKHLVFSALGKIYIMDLPKGKPRLLAPQDANQFQPVFSPDSKWVAYVSWCDTTGGFLWRIQVNGTKPEKVTKTAGQYQQPTWYPDSKQIAVIKGGPVFGPDRALLMKSYATGQGMPRLGGGIGQIQLISFKTGTTQPVADSVELSTPLSFSGSGDKLYYPPFRKPNKQTGMIGQLVGLGLRTGKADTVEYGPDISTDNSYYFSKKVSPDGHYLVYSAFESLYLVPLRGLNTVPLPYMDALKRPIQFANGVDFYWAKDSKTLNWNYGHEVFRISVDKIVAAARLKNKKNNHESGFTSVHIRPDGVMAIHLTAPASRDHGTIVLKNVNIITMCGDRLITQGTVIIHNGRFAAVGAGDQITIPAGASIYDLQGKTIIPGLIDVHLHNRLGVGGNGAPDELFSQQPWVYLAALAYGTTTSRDPSTDLASFGTAEMVRAGLMLGPRLFTVGETVHSRRDRLESQAELNQIAGRRSVMGAIVVKNYLDYQPRLPRQQLLIACEQLGMNMTNEGSHAPVAQISMIKDGSTGIEHNPWYRSVYKDIVTLYAQSGVYLTPTLQVEPEPGAKEYMNYKYWHRADLKLARFMPDNERVIGPTLIGMESYDWITQGSPNDTTVDYVTAGAKIDARILHAGGRICVGSHGNDQGIGAHNEIWALQLGGMTNMEALQCATIRGAEALGIQRDLGSIEVGKIADLIVLNSNPLDDIHNSRDIKYVMKDGILYEGDTLDELWPKFRKCPEWRLKAQTDTTSAK